MAAQPNRIRTEAKALLDPLVAEGPGPLLWAALAIALMLTYYMFGQRTFFLRELAGRCCVEGSPQTRAWWAAWYQFAAIFVLFLVVPALFFRLGLKTKLSDLGLGWCSAKVFGLVVGLGFLCLVLPTALPTGLMPGFVDEYPLARLSVSSPAHFLVYQLGYGLLYYVAWEAFFRGFCLFGLRRSFGDLGAIMFETLGSTLLHIGKPPNEIWSSLPAGILFGVVALRIRSIWPLVAVHWLLGMLTDLSCAYHAGIWP